MSNVPFVEVTANPNIPELAPGDTVRVYNRIVEGEKERVQMFQGVVIRISRGGAGANFTVRRIAHEIGVERTFPTYSPLLEKVEVTRHGKVRRARLYYLRGLSAKKARIKERRVIDKVEVEVLEPEELAAIEAEVAAEEAGVEAVVETEAAAEAVVEEAVAEEAVAEAAVVEAETAPAEEKTAGA
jgi:large subunit ribosomal protein L19